MQSLQKILKIIDLGQPEDLGVANCYALAKRLGAELHLLHVVPPKSVPIFSSDRRMRAASEKLSGISLPDTNIPIRREVREGDLVTCIAAYVHEGCIEMLIVDKGDTIALCGKSSQAVVGQLRDLLPIPILFTDRASGVYPVIC